MIVFRSCFLLLGTLAASVFALNAHAATYMVTSLADSGPGSLRQAIVDANANVGADTIVFSVTGAIVLTTGELSITESVTLRGPGAALLAVDGNASSRVVHGNGAGIQVAIDGLTVRNGAAAGSGGGILMQGAGNSLSVTNSTVSGNSATSNGGAISGDTVTIDRSTVSGNSAGPFGGGVIANALVLVNSTVSGNSAVTSGGGVGVNITATLTSSTITGNSAGTGGGLFTIGASTLTNSIIANSNGNDCLVNGGSLTSSYSLVEDGSCGVSAGTNGNLNGDPGLGPLADNGCVFPPAGGCVRTHALLAGSPAINAASQSVCSGPPVGGVDQRGFARPAPCDMGAYEFGATAPVVAPAVVPTMSEWALLMLAVLIAISAACVQHRRQPGHR